MPRQLDGFGLTARSRFGRINPPYDRQWAAGGTNQAYYRMGADLTAAWGRRSPVPEHDGGRRFSVPGTGGY